MRIVKLHHPTGHPYWKKNEFRVQMPGGNFFDLSPLFENGNHGGYEVFVRDGDIFFVQCGSGSGYGKIRKGDEKKIVSKHEYDMIEYEGEELIMSESLKTDLAENGL